MVTISNNFIFNRDFVGEIPNDAPVRVTKMQHIVEVQYLERINCECPILKLNKNEYVPLIGENKGVVLQFKHTENRAGSFASLRHTFKKLRYLINNNFLGGKNELFCTLTYAENMQDTKQLYKDFDKFMKRFKYRYSDFDYLSVIEPQGRGAWHVHLLLRFNSTDSIFIANDELRGLWRNGFVNIHRIQNVDNIGAYLTAYLADYAVDENNFDIRLMQDLMKGGTSIVEKEVEENGKKVKKHIIKGGRLYLYPVGVNLYRKSKGIVYPERIDTFYDDELKKGVLGSAKPCYTSSLELKKLSDDCTVEEHFNSIIFESYNLKR